ncbi:hypothetical protein ACP275_12G130800 [Erythranthe tilingii]
MSSIALQRPDLSRRLSYGIRGCYNFQKLPSSCTMVNSMSKEFSVGLQELSVPQIDSFSPSDVKLQRAEFVAREAQTNGEYWTAAWLRAESHWEDQEHDRYVENYKRKFAQQEFNEMKTRYSSQVGENCKCIVTVKNEDINVKGADSKSVVGTLDLSIRYLSHGENFPGERVIPPLFCLVYRERRSRYGYISNLCVAKSTRRQGIASSMLKFAVTSAKEHGAEKVFAHVYINNKSAQGLYQKMGFEVVDAATSRLSGDRMYLLCLDLKLQTCSDIYSFSI